MMLTSTLILSWALWKQSLSKQAYICPVFCMLPKCQPIPSPSRLYPTQRKGAVSRPTSAPGSVPEGSNVTSGGTWSPGLLCSQDLTHTRARAHRHGSHRLRQINLKNMTNALINNVAYVFNYLRCHTDINPHTHTHTQIIQNSRGTYWHYNSLHWQKARSPWHKWHTTNGAQTGLITQQYAHICILYLFCFSHKAIWGRATSVNMHETTRFIEQHMQSTYHSVLWVSVCPTFCPCVRQQARVDYWHTCTRKCTQYTLWWLILSIF